MDFRLSDETLEWQQYCRKFAREVVRPAAPQHDRDESVPYEVMQKAYEWKLAGLEWIQSLQTDTEGLKGVIYAEEIHWGCAGIALAISASTLCAAGVASSGTPEQIGRWIPEVIGNKDNPKIGAYAVTEPSAGSDVKSLRTTAKRDGDDWILNGTKTFISNGGIADVTVVVATVDPELGHRGQASFIVTGDNPGLKLGHKESKLGIRASQTAEIVLEDCRVPGDAPARRRGEAAAQARARPLRPELGRLGRARDVRDHAADRRRLGARHRAGRLRVDARVPARPLRGRAAAAPGAAHPAGAGRRRDRDRGGPPARVARGLDGAQRRADDRRPGLDVEAQGRRRRDVGDDRR